LAGVRKHADSREERRRKYKPLISRQCGLYLRLLSSRRAAYGGPIERPTRFVIFVFFVA
jgi:hypothetical protein